MTMQDQQKTKKFEEIISLLNQEYQKPEIKLAGQIQVDTASFHTGTSSISSP